VEDELGLPLALASTSLRATVLGGVRVLHAYVKTSGRGGTIAEDAPCHGRTVGQRMHERHAPPGRTSIVQHVTAQPRGANQCIARSGSVHALKTSSRGASKTRVIQSSRSAGIVTAAARRSSVIFHPSDIPSRCRAASGVSSRTRARTVTVVRPACPENVTVSSTWKSGRLPGSSAALVKTSRSPATTSILADHRIDGAVGRAHVDADGAAGPDIELADRIREALRAPPLRHAIGIGPRREHSLERRIEHVCEQELALGRPGSSATSSSHVSSLSWAGG
jgi:hypothetical protein